MACFLHQTWWRMWDLTIRSAVWWFSSWFNHDFKDQTWWRMMIWPSSIYIQLWKIGIYEPKWGYNLCNRTTSKCGFSQCTMDIGMSQWTMDIMWVQKWRMSIGNIWLFSVHAIGNWFQNHTASHCGCPICRVMCI